MPTLSSGTSPKRACCGRLQHAPVHTRDCQARQDDKRQACLRHDVHEVLPAGAAWSPHAVVRRVPARDRHGFLPRAPSPEPSKRASLGRGTSRRHARLDAECSGSRGWRQRVPHRRRLPGPRLVLRHMPVSRPAAFGCRPSLHRPPSAVLGGAMSRQDSRMQSRRLRADGRRSDVTRSWRRSPGRNAAHEPPRVSEVSQRSPGIV